MSDTETMVKVMSAYVDGDMIEYRNKNKMFGGVWSILDYIPKENG